LSDHSLLIYHLPPFLREGRYFVVALGSTAVVLQLLTCTDGGGDAVSYYHHDGV